MTHEPTPSGTEALVADADVGTSPGCCPVEQQSTCCEPAEKAGCCGTAATAGGGCGCR
jgi:hypothetical protein